MQQIGRIVSSTIKTARIEIDERINIEEGMLVQITMKKKTYLGRIDRLETKRLSGVTAYIYWLDTMNQPPRTFLPVYEADGEIESGPIKVGCDKRGLPIGLNLNPLFGHVLVAGMTTTGKTHYMIVLCEELGKLKVPALIFDPQGELVNLAEFDRERFVIVEDLRIDDLQQYLNMRKTVIYNMLGYSKSSKVARVAEIMRELMEKKEEDYHQAEGNTRLLQWPPLMVMIDEADIFCPHKTLRVQNRDAISPVIDVIERGSKFGLGCVIATQRITRLDIDVRSQCNSAVIFKLLDAGSIQVVRGIDYIPKGVLDDIKSFDQGECILAGSMVLRPRVCMTRDIETKRAKERDFEEMLGIIYEEEKEDEVNIIQNADGDIIEVESGQVIFSRTDRMLEEDKELFDKDEGDGIILRKGLSLDEEQLLEKLAYPEDGKPKVLEVPKSWKKDRNTR